MSTNSHNKHPLSRKGTSQSERYPVALRKDYVKFDERTLNDLIAQTAELSKYFQYYEHNSAVAEGNWSTFFEDIYDFATKEVKIKRLEELEEKSVLSPHLGLLLAFLKLFQLSIDNLNSLGEKHLLFFYEKMLRVKRRKAVSSKVTLLAELANDVNQLLIPSGTMFKAGKNAQGSEQFFATDQDFILNQAVIAELKNINFLNGKIRQRAIANSSDGKGGEILTEPKSWHAFGATTDKEAEVGFCVASPFFGINEGTRKILISIGSVELSDFDLFITTDKGWEKLDVFKITGRPYMTGMGASFPKIIPINEKIHSLKCASKDPVLKFVVKESATARYFKYKNQLASITITIEYTGIKDLNVKNDLGKIDVSKPFQPYGSEPINTQSSIIFGNPLIFNKYATSNIVADGKIVSVASYTNYLNSGIWDTNSSKLFDRQFDKEYTINTKNNYIKLKYSGTTATSKSLTVNIKKIDENNQQISVALPTSNILTWNEVSANGKIVIKSTDADVFSFYHLHPFEVVPKSANSYLLPTYDRKSYFWIGIQKLRFGQSLSLHFELLEGSGNQDIAYPLVRWFIKQGDEIVPLNENEIIKDTALKFLQSGNIQFSLAKNRFDSYNSTQEDTIWLIAACDNNYTAISNFLAVLPQAFTANYMLSETQIVEDILPDSIKKPLIQINGLKKISQPYKSFGGKSFESVDDFVIRTSERLRHKGMAINIFDYERLLLENFSFLYQVKCITHSDTTSHQAPGNVLIVVVPKLKHDNSQIDLKPKVSIGNREIIRQFLANRTSPFVKIEVRNPNYQEIKVEVNIKYLPAFEQEKEYYNAVLNKRLQTFISPWIQDVEGVEFNKVWYKSRYINFIEEQEFVDNITLFNLYIDGVKIEDKVEAVREDVVFTSVSNHIIRNDDLC